MRTGSIIIAASALLVFSSNAQSAYIAFGNQEGGLIPWVPEIRNLEVRQEVGNMAMDHCARYNRVAQVTGVVPGYGNYISFTCRFDPGYDPVKAGNSFWSRH